MALPVSDNFNRANFTPAGGNWSKTGYCQTEIYNNTLRSSSSYGFMYWNADTPQANHWAECKSVNTSNRNAGPAVRITVDTSRNGYGYSVSSKTLFKYVNNSYTALQTISSDTPNSTSVYRLEAIGTTLKVYKDGVQIGTDTTDSSHSTGRAGVWVGSASGPAVDDWAADNGASIPVTADKSVQANSSTSDAIGMTHAITAGNSTQANTSSSDAIVQTLLGNMLADNSTQINQSTSGGVAQPQAVTAGNSTQVNGSTSGAIGINYILSAGFSVQVNESTTGSVSQLLATRADNSIQVNESTSGEMTLSPGYWYNDDEENILWNIVPDDSTTWSPSPPITSNWS
jgi:hypothetical protein